MYQKAKKKRDLVGRRTTLKSLISQHCAITFFLTLNIIVYLDSEGYLNSDSNHLRG